MQWEEGLFPTVADREGVAGDFQRILQRLEWPVVLDRKTITYIELALDLEVFTGLDLRLPGPNGAVPDTLAFGK